MTDTFINNITIKYTTNENYWPFIYDCKRLFRNYIRTFTKIYTNYYLIEDSNYYQDLKYVTDMRLWNDKLCNIDTDNVKALLHMFNYASKIIKKKKIFDTKKDFYIQVISAYIKIISLSDIDKYVYFLTVIKSLLSQADDIVKFVFLNAIIYQCVDLDNIDEDNASVNILCPNCRQYLDWLILWATQAYKVSKQYVSLEEHNKKATEIITMMMVSTLIPNALLKHIKPEYKLSNKLRVKLTKICLIYGENNYYALPFIIVNEQTVMLLYETYYNSIHYKKWFDCFKNACENESQLKLLKSIATIYILQKE